MVDLIKKAIITGVGLAVLTKEKAEELVQELTQQAKLSEQEGKELFDGLLKQSENARNDLQSKLDETVLAVVNGSTWQPRMKSRAEGQGRRALGQGRARAVE